MTDVPATSDQSLRGLTAAEASARLKAEGHNALPEPDKRSVPMIVLGVLKEPMFALLLGGGTIYLVLGDHAEALMLIAFAGLSVVITVVQELRSERVLAALRDLTSPRALVIRDGKRVRIAGREVVRGDLVVLGEGDRVPADARLISAAEMQIDESLLTGESQPVHKHPGAAEAEAAEVYAGCLVVRGHGIAEVFATGPHSRIGRIGRSLGELEARPTALTLELRRMVRFMAVVGLGVSGVVAIGTGLLRHSWAEGLLGGIAVAMSMMPEEFPLVLTVFMTMGAWRISRERVLTRRSAAIERLGSATVLCVDKTGTLTENRMRIVALQRRGEPFQHKDGALVGEADRPLVRAGVLASAPHPFDPIDRAFQDAGEGWLEVPHGWRLAREFGVRPDLFVMAQAWAADEARALYVAAKGAPEAVVRLCDLPAEEAERIHDEVHALADQGMRVLAVAEGWSEAANLDRYPQGLQLSFLGLVGLADPLRADVPAAVADCRSAGVRVVMITGDHPSTARAIARQAGLEDGDVVTGAELAELSDAALAQRIGEVSVFARIAPEQKLRIVEALKAKGEVVAMTGDGVNDSPAIKAADIGIAMGGRGADVAREAAALVLLDDDFGSIVKTVRLGRRIYDNLQKACGYILAVHVPIAGLCLAPLVFGLPILLAPVHIAFLEMIIDPVCSIVFEAEPEEQGVMRRPPRRPDAPLLPRSEVVRGLLQGIVVLLAAGGAYGLALWRGLPEDGARSVGFVSLVLANLGLVVASRSFSASPWQALSTRNPALWIVMVCAPAILGLALAIPEARVLFRLAPLDGASLATAVAAGLLSFLAVEALKAVSRRRA